MTMTVFGYLIIFNIDFFTILFLHFVLQFQMKRNKHSRQRLTTFSNTLKFIKNNPLCIVFSALSSMFGNVVNHGLLCLI